MKNSGFNPIKENKNINQLMYCYLQEILELYHRENFSDTNGCSDNISKESSFIHLQRRLALRTFYLREYVLTPLMNHLISKGIKSELFRLYRAYCYFFNRELSVKEFSAFLSHVIIDGFLRACIFYLTTGSNPGKPFSRDLVFKYAKFTGMPEMRLAVFKYLSPGPGDEPIPGAVQWILDEICVFLENFDFKQTGFSSKNYLVMDGESLQWEGYFFRPYYDNEEYKAVLELLQNSGIFSSVIDPEKQEKWSGTKKNEGEGKKMNRNEKK